MYNKIFFPKEKNTHLLDYPMACDVLADLISRPFINSPRNVDKPLVLYGAGNLGRMAKDFLNRVNIPIAFVVDQYPELHKQDPFWDGLEIVAPKDVLNVNKTASLLAVSICTIPFSELYEMLLQQGWNDVVPFYDVSQGYYDTHPLNNGWFTGVVSDQDVSEINKILLRWNDDISRAHHIQFVAWHSLREDWVFEGAPVTTHDRYFIPEVRSVLHDRESLLDVGAHHGEVTIKFLETVAHQFKTAWVIEPDNVNLSDLHVEFNTKLQGDDAAKIDVLTCAVGELSGRQMFFEGINYSSQFSELGGRELEVRTIDELAIHPSLIKIHLEGHELSALKGALQTIINCRPIIVSTTYHNHLGLWKLPSWLMDNLSDYTFLFRLHSWCGTGSVMYAIPVERALTKGADKYSKD